MRKQNETRSTIEEVSFFRKYWWVIAFCLLSYITYDQVMKSRGRDLAEVEHQIHLLQGEKQLVMNEKEDLLLKINSQSDPAWIELMLMKELGVVPDGHLKVHFTNE